MSATGLSATAVTATGMTTTGLTTSGSTTSGVKQPGQRGGTLALTGGTVQAELLMAGLAVGLGTLLLLLSQRRRRWMWSPSAAGAVGRAAETVRGSRCSAPDQARLVIEGDRALPAAAPGCDPRLPDGHAQQGRGVGNALT